MHLLTTAPLQNLYYCLQRNSKKWVSSQKDCATLRSSTRPARHFCKLVLFCNFLKTIYMKYDHPLLLPFTISE